jgi:hypothetical protein
VVTFGAKIPITPAAIAVQGAQARSKVKKRMDLFSYRVGWSFKKSMELTAG